MGDLSLINDLIIAIYCIICWFIYLPFIVWYILKKILPFQSLPSFSISLSKHVIFLFIPYSIIQINIAIPITLFQNKDKIKIDDNYIYIHSILLSFSLFLINFKYLQYISNQSNNKKYFKLIKILIVLFEFGLLIMIIIVNDKYKRFHYILILFMLILYNLIKLIVITIIHQKILRKFYFLFEIKVIIFIKFCSIIIYGCILTFIFSRNVSNENYTFLSIIIMISFIVVLNGLIWVQLGFIRIFLYHYNDYDQHNICSILFCRYKYQTIKRINIKQSNEMDKLFTLLSTQDGFSYFLKHLTQQKCSENILYLVEYSQLIENKYPQIFKQRNDIISFSFIPINNNNSIKYLYDKFIQKESEHLLNISSRVNNITNHNDLTITTLNICYQEILTNLQDAFYRFSFDQQFFINDEEKLLFLNKFYQSSGLISVI